MKLISTAILSAAIVFLFSCEESNKSEKQEVEVHNHDDHAGHDHAGHDHSGNDHDDHAGHDHDDHSGHDHATQKGNTVVLTKGKLGLNNGKKWVLSESLNNAANGMSTKVDEFVKSGSQDYNGLAGELSDATSDLINKCELPDGIAHANLHEWLSPYMASIKEMGNANTPEEGKASFIKIQESLNSYGKYFE